MDCLIRLRFCQKQSSPGYTPHPRSLKMCPAFLYDSSSGAKTSHWKARYELHHGERGELGELASIKTPALCSPACPLTPETPASKWAPCWDTEVPSQSDARPLPVLETLAGPLEDCSTCAEAGTEAILKIRRGKVINEYEISFSGQGLPARPGLTAGKFIAKDSVENSVGICMGDGLC